MHTGTGFANGQIMHTGTGSALVVTNYANELKFTNLRLFSI